jgi:AcrR family transcriptional regulator
MKESLSTKDRILETALKLFSKKGYLGATTREIAKEAGIAEITLFRYFSSKEELFGSVLNKYSFLPVLKGLLPEITHLPYEEGLKAIAEKFLDVLNSRKDIIQIMHSEIHRYPEKIHEIYHSFIDEILKVLASYFDGLKKKKVLREFNSEFGARAFLGMLFSYFNLEELLLRKKYKSIDAGLITKHFIDIFMNGTLKKGAKP